MKLLKSVLFLSIAAVSLVYAGCNDCDFRHTAKSYLNVRPMGQSNSPELISGARYNSFSDKEDGHHAKAYIVAFGGQSTDSGKLARYFFPFGKRTLQVKSSTSITNTANSGNFFAEGDLLADHFNVFTANGLFESAISICPKRSEYGAILYARKSFWHNEEKEQSWWASISFPIEHVRTTLEFNEKVTVDGGGVSSTASPAAVANMTQAFNQAAWKYGKIHCSDMGKTGVADVELKLGYEWMNNMTCHLETYAGMLIPTGNKPSGVFLFEPIIGNGKHVGAMWGSSFGMTFYEDEARDRVLRAEFAMNSEYLFSRHQVRSFDVKDKSWSRYMGVYTDVNQAEEANVLPNPLGANFQTPGINVFTREVKVTPGFQHDFNGAVVYKSEKTYAEIGWNYFSRQDECVELECGFPETIAFRALQGDGATSDIRDITGKPELESTTIAFPNYQDAVIKEGDLDLESASSPAFVSHTLYATVGCTCERYDHPILAAVGGSYEWASDTNAGLDRWALWGKLGVSF